MDRKDEEDGHLEADFSLITLKPKLQVQFILFVFLNVTSLSPRGVTADMFESLRRSLLPKLQKLQMTSQANKIPGMGASR